MSRKRAFGLTLFAAFLFFTSACVVIGLPSDDPLEDTSWELLTIRGVKPIDGTSITAEFKGGEVRGSAGCNSYFGSYKARGNAIEISEIGSTLMACLEPEGIMDQEQLFTSFLSDAHEYRLDDGQLQIFRSDGEALMFISSQ